MGKVLSVTVEQPCFVEKLRALVDGLSGKEGDERTHGPATYQFRHLGERYAWETGTGHDHERCWARCCDECAAEIRAAGTSEIRTLTDRWAQPAQKDAPFIII